ncbi:MULTISPECIES: type II secretion system secretin GspD [unclassified Bradyrhizobium]|uniref:type II secretion system secretin GspD n=1 Tax=unclassified Bradyrhizobium TaxID=2631580 RepID=UPI000710A8E0|nr:MULTISPECIES: type II secretion system secretin GspD [unclassified Bradyrhizobium]KQT03046.1 type II secretion system protein GspD [Bradyrhizobium sp. Leaf396]
MSRTAFRIGLIVHCGLLCVLLGSCNTVSGIANVDAKDPDVFDKVRSIDLLPRYPNQLPQRELSTGPRAKTAIYTGASGEDAPVATSSQQASVSADRFELNFDNSPIASVAKVVLGDILGVGYVIDPRVQGNISLSSGRPIPKSDVVFALENALRIGGIALVRDDTGYRLMPQADAVGAGAADASDRMTPGYGVTVVPLQYVSAQTVIKLVDSFATKQGMIRAETGRNLILIQGSGSERRNAVDLVLSFDADFLKGQSVGVFPVQNSNPGPIIAELEKIVDSGEGGMTQNLIKFQSIARMNAVLAVTRRPELLKRVETWIRRLDTTNSGRSAVHVYRVKFGDSKQIARVLNDVFGSGGGAGSSTSPLDGAGGPVAPGSGIAASSSGGSALSRLSAAPASSSGGFSSNAGGRAANSASVDPSSGQAGYATSSNAQAATSLFDSTAGQNTGRGGASASNVLDGVRITADSVNNTLLIYASQEQYRIIEQTIREIDQPQLQVAIDATIAEVTLTDDLQYGVQSYIMSRDVGLKPNTGSFGYNGATSVAAAAADVVLQRAIPGFNFLVGSAQTPRAVLNALHAVTDVKVLSNPSVVVIDNQIATLQVGDEIPIQTGSATVLTGNNTIANTTDYRSTGIILRVVPRINANGNVRLDVEQEISNPVNNSSTSQSSSTSTNSLTPTVSTRKVRSSVAVASGQTVLLAGLISDTQTKARAGIPGLDQIPGLGEVVFGQTDKQVRRTELIIFIRPQIIRDGADAHFVAEELRTKLRGTINAIGPQPNAPTTYR